MAYLSLYRKWRPQTFADVVGQEHVVRTVKNALRSGRVAHAYVFAGPRGTGKTTLARLLAKGLNCINVSDGDPCGECDVCQRIARGHSVDVIEIDGASNRGIDEIRDVREKVKFAPAEGQYKVYIIDEVHMLTTEAFNALLKVLEEPPSHVVFVFATTEPHRIPATILSRCQKFDFRAFTSDEVVRQLKAIAESEDIEVSDGALRLMARHSEGGMRDAIGYLDQCASFASGSIDSSLVSQVLGVVERERLDALADALKERDLASALILIKDLTTAGIDLRQFANDAVEYFRDLMLLRSSPGNRDIVALTEEERGRALERARGFEVDELLRIVDSLGKAASDMRWATNAQLPLEMALIELVKVHPLINAQLTDAKDVNVEALMERVARLEAKVERLSSQAPRRPPRDVPFPDKPQADVPKKVPVSGDESTGSPPTPDDTGAPSVEPDPTHKSRGPAAPLVSQGGELLHQVRELWPRVLEGLRADRYIQQEAFVREGEPGSIEDGSVVVLYFSPSHRFHQANMEQEKNKRPVEKAISRMLGKDMKIKAVLGTPPRITEEEATSSESDFPASVGQSLVADAATETDSKGSEFQNGDNASKEHFKPQEVDPNEIDEPILKAALKLFGGTITKLERKETES